MKSLRQWTDDDFVRKYDVHLSLSIFDRTEFEDQKYETENVNSKADFQGVSYSEEKGPKNPINVGDLTTNQAA